MCFNHDAIAYGYADVALRFDVRRDFEANMSFAVDSVVALARVQSRMGTSSCDMPKTPRVANGESVDFRNLLLAFLLANLLLRDFLPMAGYLAQIGLLRVLKKS